MVASKLVCDLLKGSSSLKKHLFAVVVKILKQVRTSIGMRERLVAHFFDCFVQRDLFFFNQDISDLLV